MTLGPTENNSGGWSNYSSTSTNFLILTNQMQVRFRAADLGTGSIIEAAVDDIEIISLDPSSGPIGVPSAVRRSQLNGIPGDYRCDWHHRYLGEQGPDQRHETPLLLVLIELPA